MLLPNLIGQFIVQYRNVYCYIAIESKRRPGNETNPSSKSLHMYVHTMNVRTHDDLPLFVSSAGSKLDDLDKDGYSPLHLAVAHTHISSVQVLLQLGANVNIKNRCGVWRVYVVMPSQACWLFPLYGPTSVTWRAS